MKIEHTNKINALVRTFRIRSFLLDWHFDFMRLGGAIYGPSKIAICFTALKCSMDFLNPDVFVHAAYVT